MISAIFIFIIYKSEAKKRQLKRLSLSPSQNLKELLLPYSVIFVCCLSPIKILFPENEYCKYFDYNI